VYSCELHTQNHNGQGLKWVGTHGHAVPAGSPFLQSGVPRPQRALFLCERTFSGRKDSFVHENAKSESEFGQDDINKYRGPAAKLKETHILLMGARDF